MVTTIDGLDKPITNEAELRLFLMNHLKVEVGEIRTACNDPMMYRRTLTINLMLDNIIISTTELK